MALPLTLNYLLTKKCMNILRQWDTKWALNWCLIHTAAGMETTDLESRTNNKYIKSSKTRHSITRSSPISNPTFKRISNLKKYMTVGFTMTMIRNHSKINKSGSFLSVLILTTRSSLTLSAFLTSLSVRSMQKNSRNWVYNPGESVNSWRQESWPWIMGKSSTQKTSNSLTSQVQILSSYTLTLCNL